MLAKFIDHGGKAHSAQHFNLALPFRKGYI